MARPERFELPTTWFVARYSIQLSYGRVFVKGANNNKPLGLSRPLPCLPSNEPDLVFPR
jgi:hypothetical protein